MLFPKVSTLGGRCYINIYWLAWEITTKVLKKSWNKRRWRTIGRSRMYVIPKYISWWQEGRIHTHTPVLNLHVHTAAPARPTRGFNAIREFFFTFIYVSTPLYRTLRVIQHTSTNVPFFFLSLPEWISLKRVYHLYFNGLHVCVYTLGCVYVLSRAKRGKERRAFCKLAWVYQSI